MHDIRVLGQNAPLFRFTLLCDEVEPSSLVIMDPVGSDDLGLSLVRNQQLHGITTEYSMTLGFVKEGKQYLQQLYDMYGVGVDVFLLIEQYDPNSFLWVTFYRGRVKLVGNEVTATEFTCELINEGFTQKFLSRDDTAVDIFKRESTGGSGAWAPNPTSVELHSRALVLKYEATVADVPQPSAPDFVTDDDTRFGKLYIGFGEPKTNELDIPLMASGPFMGTQPAVPFYTLQESGRFDIDFNADTKLVISRTGNGYGDFDDVDVTYWFQAGNNPPVQLAQLVERNAGGAYERFPRLQHTGTYDLNLGDGLFLYADMHVFDISAGIFGYRFQVTNEVRPGSYMKISAYSKTLPTPCNGVLVHEAFDRIARSITDSGTAFRSAFFGRTDTIPAYPQDGPGSGMLLAGGFQVRGFPLDKKSLTMKWRDLFDSLSAVHNLGVGIERIENGKEVVRVEPMEYFYRDNVVLDLGDTVSNVRIKDLPERYYVGAKVGYTKWQPDQVNGLDEFNSKREWASPLAVVENSYDRTSTYIASGLAMERVRRTKRYDEKSTTDDSSDNDMYLVCLLRKPDGSWQTERNQYFVQVDGLLDPDSAYNLRITPARMLRRHAPALTHSLRHPGGANASQLRFTQGEGNNDLVTRLVSETEPVAEKGNLPLATIPPALWAPRSWVLEAPMKLAQTIQLMGDPLGRIRFRYNGRTVEGWIIQFEYHATGKSGPLGDFTLLECSKLLPYI